MDFSGEVGTGAQTAASISVGEPVTSQLETGADSDWFRIDLVEGARYIFDLSGTGSSGALSNPLLRVHQNSQLLVQDDDGGPGVDPRIIFTAPSTGTYYLEAASPASQSGTYRLMTSNLSNPVTPSSNSSLLDSIDWGTRVGRTSIDVYFAEHGESFAGYSSFGWTNYEIGQAFAAMAEYEAVTNLAFNRVLAPENADFKLVIAAPLFFAGLMAPPGETDEGVGIFSRSALHDGGGLIQGGRGFQILLHEFAHGLGLAHPHDTGGTSTKLNGVDLSFGDYGDYGLNQGVFTNLSYNNGYRSETGREPDKDYGLTGTLSPLDIAVLQSGYGANDSANVGATTYELTSTNGPGTFYSAIWDTNGIDWLSHNSEVNATLDLRAATLEYEVGGGGFVSKVEGIFGGFTIANGVVIENARGGSGDDILNGNDVANRLNGGAGADIITGGAGVDILTGGSGADTFVFGDGDEGAVVTDLSEQDALLFVSSNAAQAVLNTATQSGTDTLLTFNGTQITLRNVTDASLTHDGAEIVMSDAPSASQGNDTYTYSRADVDLVITATQETATSGTNDRVIFSDIALDEVEFRYDAGDLQVAWLNGAQSGTLNIAENGRHIESYEFADGSVIGSVSAELWSLGRDRLLGTSGNDKMHAGNDGSTGGVLMLSGLDGDDDLKGAHYLQGGAGNDTYRIAQDSSTRLIYAETSGDDRIIFEDIDLADVSFELIDTTWITDRLRISWTNDDDTKQFVDVEQDGSGIESYEFADGSVIGSVSAELWSLGRDRLLGTSGNDKMHAGNDGSTGGVLMLSGLDGDDDLKGAHYLQGGAGNDTYRIAQDSSTRLIYAETSGDDRIIFEDIDLADVSFELIDTTWITDRLRISWTNDDDTKQFVDVEQDGSGIESYEFADGSALTYDGLII
jgi:Ca2+-binding RTX toxin-like protein